MSVGEKWFVVVAVSYSLHKQKTLRGEDIHIYKKCSYAAMKQVKKERGKL